MRITTALVAPVCIFLFAGCTREQPPAATQPVFRPEVWFVGEMHSTGALKALGRPPRGLAVESTGRRPADGSLRLDQAIHWAGGAIDHRFWIMRPAQPGRYVVSLSDARGPVFFETRGARAHLRYRDRRGPLPLIVEQWMDLQPDGRTLANRGVITVWGAPVARLTETITHDPAPSPGS